MNVSTQIERAINEAINEKVLPQIQVTLRSGPGQVLNRRWKSRLEDRNVDPKKS